MAGGVVEPLGDGAGRFYCDQVAVGVPFERFLLLVFKGFAKQAAGLIVIEGDGALQRVGALDQLAGRVVLVSGGVAPVVALGGDAAGGVVSKPMGPALFVGDAGQVRCLECTLGG